MSDCTCWFFAWCVVVCVHVLALETDRSHFKAKLLVALPKVWHLDVQQRKMLHLWRVDLQDCPVKALTVLQGERHTSHTCSYRWTLHHNIANSNTGKYVKRQLSFLHFCFVSPQTENIITINKNKKGIWIVLSSQKQDESRDTFRCCYLVLPLTCKHLPFLPDNPPSTSLLLSSYSVR